MLTGALPMISTLIYSYPTFSQRDWDEMAKIFILQVFI